MNLTWTNPRPCWWEAKGEMGRRYIIQGVDGSVMWLFSYNPTAPTDSLRQQEQKFSGASATLEAIKALAEKRERMIAAPASSDFDELMNLIGSNKIQL